MKWRWVAIGAAATFIATWYTLYNIFFSMFFGAIVGICIQMAFIFAKEEDYLRGQQYRSEEHTSELQSHP